MQQALSLLRRSVGKKLVMAVTGLLLSGFLVAHLAGNLLLLKGPEAFNLYAATMRANPLLPVLEAGLAAIFLAHIVSGLRVAFENRLARPRRYEVRTGAGAQSWASATMPYTGVLLIVFLAIHLWTFRLAHTDDFYTLVTEALKSPLYAGFYAAAMLGMTLHVSHGFSSAFQTLGVSHPRWQPLIKGAGWAFAASMLGFLGLVVWAFSRCCGGAA